MSDIAQIAREIVLKAFTWEVWEDGSVGIELRGSCKCLSDLNLDAETEVYIRRTIRNHISAQIVVAGEEGDARLIEQERKRNERRAEGEAKP